MTISETGGDLGESDVSLIETVVAFLSLCDGMSCTVGPVLSTASREMSEDVSAVAGSGQLWAS